MKLKHLIIGFIFLLFTGNLFSQSRSNPVADSLLGVWRNEAQSDTVRLFAVHTLIWDHLLFSQPDSAYRLSQQQELYSEKAGSKNYLADAINSQGISLAIRGENDRALLKFEQVLKIKTELRDSSGIAGAIVNMGNIHRDIGNYTLATSCYQNSSGIYAGMKNWQGWANAIDNLGIVLSYSGNLTGAIDYFEKAKAIRLEKNDQRGLPTSYSNLATAYNDLGVSDKAVQWYLLAMELHTKNGNKQGIATAMNNLAIQYKQKGNYAAAMEMYRESLLLRKKINDKNGISSTLNNIGNLYRVMNEKDSAMHYFHRSLEVRKSLNDKLAIAFAMNNIGSYHHDLGNYDSALVYLNNALEIAQAIRSTSEIRRALRYQFATYYRRAAIPTAAEKLRGLMEIRQKDIEINLALLAETDKEKYFATMEEDFLLHDAFMVNHNSTRPDLTIQSYNQALLLKGLILRGSGNLRADILASKDSLLIESYYSWLTVKRKIAKAYSRGKDATALEEEAQSLEATLIRKSSAFKQQLEEKNVDWKQVQHSLVKGEAAIEFLRIPLLDLQRSENNLPDDVMYVALVIKKDFPQPLYIPLCKEEQLQALIAQKSSGRKTKIESAYTFSGRESLYSLLCKPLEPVLNDVRTIYFSPAGLLHKISFSAIRNRDGRYVSSVIELNPLLSTGSLIQRKKSSASGIGPLFLFGGVDYSDTLNANVVWTFLEGTLTEVESIQRKALQQKKSVKKFTGKNAGEAQFKSCSGEKGILHIATHGFFYPDPSAAKDTTHVEIDAETVFRSGARKEKDLFFLSSPHSMMRSGLVFAGANKLWSEHSVSESEEDGILTAQEIAGLDLSGFSLVVLSACETGLGDVRGYEGVYGLQRAFKVAGAHYLIMSLWEVPDKETAEFMELFYGVLLKNGNIRKSFQIAQNGMRKKYSPYYWAAFVLVE